MKNLKNLILGLFMGMSTFGFSQTNWTLNWCTDPFQNEMTLSVSDTLTINFNGSTINPPNQFVTCSYEEFTGTDGDEFIVVPNCSTAFVWIQYLPDGDVSQCMGNWGWTIHGTLLDWVWKEFDVDQTSSIGENKVVDFEMFPNPSNDLITVTVKNRSKFQIFSSSGQLIISSMMNFGNNTVDISNLPSGIYFAKMGDVTKQLIRL